VADWFRGVVEGAFVGVPAALRPGAAPADFVAFDLRLYRASVAAVELVTEEDATGEPADASTTQADSVAAPQKLPPPLRQDELGEVHFIGVGAESLKDHHAAFDIRVNDLQILGSTEVDGKIYGRLSGAIVGRLTPPKVAAQEALAARKRARAVQEQLGTWVETFRWVMVALVTWLCFGLCSAATGTLWLLVVIPSALLYLVTRGVIGGHAARAFGWVVVLASASLGGLLFYRVTNLECDSALWWLSGMVAAVVVSAPLPSRYPFLWTKAILAATVLSLCSVAGTCVREVEASREVPSVINQGPRTDPDGRWPRHPDP
jgi:hypothetical protein